MIVNSVEKRFMLLKFFFSSVLDNSSWIKYDLQWNVSVIINEAIKKIYRINKFLPLDCSCLKSLCGLSLFLCQNDNIQVVEEVVLFSFRCNIWQENNFFECHSCFMESP